MQCCYTCTASFISRDHIAFAFLSTFFPILQTILHTHTHTWTHSKTNWIFLRAALISFLGFSHQTDIRTIQDSILKASESNGNELRLIHQFHLIYEMWFQWISIPLGSPVSRNQDKYSVVDRLFSLFFLIFSPSLPPLHHTLHLSFYCCGIIFLFFFSIYYRR